MDIRQQIEKIRLEIHEHDYKYYVLAQPTISDYDYDQLMKKLENLENANPELITPDSPTQRVSGLPTKIFQTIQHRKPMLSLANTYNEEEIKEFDKRVRSGLKMDESVEYVVELKIDGVAVSLTYENGILIRGLKRGDGIQGDDITNNLKTIRSNPLRLQSTDFVPAMFEVRGEVYYSQEAFERLNANRQKENEPLFANPRNAAAGTLNMQDPRIVSERKLQIFTYYLDTEDPKFVLSTHAENLKKLKNLTG